MPRDLRNKNIAYNDTVEGDRLKVTATLKGKDSEAYTKLVKKLARIEKLQSEIDELQGQVKAETKELVTDLFDAADAVKTRVVKTKSIILTLSKDPKPTEGYKYAEIVKAIEKQLTPKLKVVLEELKEKFKTVTHKGPKLDYEGTIDIGESRVIKEDVFAKFNLFAQRLRREMRAFKSLVLRWTRNYDRLLDEIETQLGEA